MSFIDQQCQAFDPIMILPEKAANITDPMKMNTSCVAPAYVYLEGSRGKRFLCDYHYFFEKDVTICRTPHLWPAISNYMIEKLESIKQTFAKSDGIQEIKDDTICWCKKQAYVRVTSNSLHSVYFCNFHYRKSYYRHVSNNIIFENVYSIRDERHRLNLTIIEEMEQLTVV